METSQFAHDAFISYSRRDRAFAAQLEKALKGYKPPQGVGLPPRYINIFRDESDSTGTEYFSAIDTHLRQSRKLILLCSPAARASEFVGDEVRRFIEVSGAGNVIPLLVAGIPNNEAKPGQEDQMAFPQALCDAMQMPLATPYLDFDPKRHKIARGGFESSWYTLLANLYEVSRSAIEQRERSRQARQRRVVAGVTGAVILLLLGALYVTVLSRNEAVRQRDIAEERRRAALARQLNVEADAALAGGAEGVRRSVLLGIESIRANWTAEGHEALLRTIDLLPKPPADIRRAHQTQVHAMTFSRDGQWLASEAEDSTVIWDRASRQEIKRLPPSGRGQRRALAFSPDRRWLVASCRPAAACVWDTSAWTIAAPIQHARMVQSAEFSPDGKLLATAAPGSTEIQLRETGTWRSLPTLGAKGMPNAQIGRLAFSPDGRFLAAVAGPRVTLWDVARRRVAAQIEGTRAASLILAFSPDGRWLATHGTDGGLSMIAVKADPAGTIRLTADPDFHTPPVGERGAPVFSPDGTRLAVGLRDGSLSVIALPERRETTRIALTPEALAFDPGSGELISGNEDGSIAVWRHDEKETLRLPHPGASAALAISSDGRWVAAIDTKRTVRVFDTQTRQLLATLEPAEDGAAIDFSRDGRWLLLTSDHVVRVADTISWREVLRHRVDGWSTGDVMVTPDGHWLIIKSGQYLRRYATGTWREAPAIEVQADSYFISPDGQRLATHSQWSFARGLGLLHPSMTRVWDIASGEPVAWLSHETEDLKLGMFGSLGRAPNASSPWTSAISGGDAALATASLTWPALQTLTEARKPPNEPWLATANVRAKPLSEANIERAARAHGSEVTASAFSADGRWLASSGNDGTLRLWLLPTSDLIAEACARVARNLSEEEWKRHLGEDAYRQTCPDLPPVGETR